MTAFLPNLQILRAFAALAVVMVHCFGKGYSTFGQGAEIWRWYEWGSHGVDLFFVLSGFIMVHTQMRDDFSWPRFARGRAVRILPSYFIVTALAAGILALAPAFVFFVPQELSLGVLAAAFSFTSVLVLGQLPLVELGWTLEFEMLFYLAFGALMAVGVRSSVALFAGIAAFAAGLVWFTNVQPVFLEFLFGVAVAIIYRGTSASPRLGLAILLLGCLLLCLTFFGRGSEDARVFYWGLPAALVVLGAVWAPQIKPQGLLLLGAASYSIYLVHFLTVPITINTLGLIAPGTTMTMAAAVAFVTSVTIATLFYSHVERPIQERFNSGSGLVRARKSGEVQ